MPEETNRVVNDELSDRLFTSEPAGNENLEREGVPPARVHLVGNVIDTLLAHPDRARSARCHERLGLHAQGYAVLAFHRPSYVDSPERLTSILRAVHAISARMPVVFPVHPRTRG